MGTSLVYRVPGSLSGKSLRYIDQMMALGYPEEQIDIYKTDFCRFESASVMGSFETALNACIYKIPEGHYPFLRELHEHIKALSCAERGEELLRKASTSDKESIAANTLLSRPDGGFEEGEGASAQAVINFNVKDPKKEVKVTRGG
jgi:hypothetical protein